MQLNGLIIHKSSVRFRPAQNVSGQLSSHQITFFMRSFKTLESDVRPILELPVPISCEVMSLYSSSKTGPCSIWVDLEGKAEESGASELQKNSAVEQNGAESSVYLILSGPRLTLIRESKWSSFRKSVRCVHVPDSVENIGDGCFRDCTGLLRVVFGERSSLKWMGVEAFKNCRKLEAIHIPKNVEQICDCCFFACTHLRRITFHECSVLKRIGEQAFSGWAECTCPITEIHIPDSVEELCDSCFYECEHLSSITFGPQSSLKRLGASLFFGVYHNYACPLREIRIPDRVEIIEDSCFYSCPELSSVMFGERSSLKVIGPRAFSGDCDCGCPLGSIQIPDSVERLCSGCFSGCSFLSCVSFGEAPVLRRIDCDVFCNCSLNEIRIPDTVTKLGAWCFRFSHLSRVTFGESSSLKRIGTGCFFSSELVEFSIPKSVELLEGCVFSGCPLCDGVTCVENPHLSIFDSLLLSSSNELGVCCPVVGVLSEVVIPANVKYISDYCFYEHSQLSCIIFSAPSTLRRLGDSAFHGCGVTELLIPSSVVDIGDRCFAGCKRLVRATFSEPSELKTIGKDAFNRCKRLERIHIPDGVEDLSDQCFFGCKACQYVTFGEASSLRRMGFKALSCPIREIHIPDSVEEICDGCFSGCQRDVQVTFGESSALKRIHCHAFGARSEPVLERISLPPAAVFFGDPKCFS